MATRRQTTRNRIRDRRRVSPRKKKAIKDMYRSKKHPCERCGRKTEARFCYKCGHYDLGLF